MKTIYNIRHASSWDHPLGGGIYFISKRRFQYLIGEVAGIAHNELALGGLALAGDAARLTLLVVHHLGDGFVQHVGAAVDRRKTSESL